MKTLLLIICCLSFWTSAYACSSDEINFEQNNVCAKIQWITGPSENEYNAISVTFSNYTPYKLNVVPWMVMAGHEHGSRPVTITNPNPNEFLVTKIYFMGGMMGEWFLKLQLINDKKEVVEEQKISVEL